MERGGTRRLFCAGEAGARASFGCRATCLTTHSKLDVTAACSAVHRISPLFFLPDGRLLRTLRERASSGGLAEA